MVPKSFTVKQTQPGTPNTFSQSQDKSRTKESAFFNQQTNHREGELTIVDLSGNMLFLDWLLSIQNFLPFVWLQRTVYVYNESWIKIYWMAAGNLED